MSLVGKLGKIHKPRVNHPIALLRNDCITYHTYCCFKGFFQGYSNFFFLWIIPITTWSFALWRRKRSTNETLDIIMGKIYRTSSVNMCNQFCQKIPRDGTEFPWEPSCTYLHESTPFMEKSDLRGISRGPYTPHITLVCPCSTYADPLAWEITPVRKNIGRCSSLDRPSCRLLVGGSFINRWKEIGNIILLNPYRTNIKKLDPHVKVPKQQLVRSCNICNDSSATHLIRVCSIVSRWFWPFYSSSIRWWRHVYRC